MLEQDYVTRSIKGMVRTILKLILKIDSEDPSEKILEQEEQRQKLQWLLQMSHEGNINDAENEIYEILEGGDQEDMKLAILFYSGLNEMSEEFLNEYDFSKEEVKDGLKMVLNKYNYSGISEIF